MSAATAFRLPLEESQELPERHLEIAPSRAQRRARPRLYAALVAVGGIAVILLAQLLMSIVLADGAYRISGLQVEMRDLAREQSATLEELGQLSSTQNLISNAEALGMVSSGNPVFLDVTNQEALGTSSRPNGQRVGVGGNLIGNALLDGSIQLDPATIAQAHNSDALPAAPAAATTDADAAPSSEADVVPEIAADGTIPSPTTR